MNAIAQELHAMAARLRELFPESDHVELHAQSYEDGSLEQSVLLHRVGDYHDGTAFFRRLGIGERSKAAFPESDDINHAWCALRGELDGVQFQTFCSGLPPSCRIETKTKRIPKTETVDTGEFIEVQERVVKCGQLEAVV